MVEGTVELSVAILRLLTMMVQHMGRRKLPLRPEYYEASWPRNLAIPSLMSTLAFREARRHVYSFSDESEIMRDHREALECLDCEAVLQLGIDAFNWLVLADETIRRATYRGAEFDADTSVMMSQLFRHWLRPCAVVNQWIAVQKDRGYNLANLEELRRCEREVQAIVRSLDADSLTEPMRGLRDSAVAEHRDGQTAEFV
jgi:hypothetical protein